MSPVLMTREDIDKGALAHYRTQGSENGVRLYQNKDGSLTPLGRIHYGVGKARRAASEEIKGFIKIAASKDKIEKASAQAEVYKNRSDRAKEKAEEDLHRNNIDKADKHSEKAAEFDKMYNKYKDKEAKLKEKEEKWDRSDKEIKKAVEDRIESFNKKTQEAKQKRAEENEARNAKLKDEIAEIRSLSDMELNKRIERLQKERTYAELVNQRNAYEQSPLHAKASKLFSEAAEKLARKALDRAGDELLNKLMKKAKNGDNTNSKDTVNSGNKDNSKDSKSDSSSKPDNSGGNSGKFSKGQKAQIRSMASSGKSVADIAKSLGATEDQVKGFLKSAGITIS